MQKPYDIIVFGATGFTGHLVAQYLAGLPASEAPHWALAGRDLAKLERVRTELARPDLALVQADAQDPVALSALVAQTKVVISTVGPYQLHGQALVMACAEMGTDYVDLCGEPVWMAQMIPQLQAPAQASGARIVFSCGFDSVPFDLGVWYLQQGAPAPLRPADCHGAWPRASDERQRLGWHPGQCARHGGRYGQKSTQPRYHAQPLCPDPRLSGATPTRRRARSI
jgi:hypothetical protein